VQKRANATLVTIAKHIHVLGLRLVVEKAEAVVFTSRYGTAVPRLRLESQPIQLGASLKYLSVILENKGTMFGAHLDGTSDKAEWVISALPDLMPIIGDMREGCRRLLMSVVHAILLYDARRALVLTANCRHSGTPDTSSHRSLTMDA